MDTLANMLSGIQNAGKAKKEKVVFPFSHFKANIAKALVETGFIKAVHTVKSGNFDALEIVIAYKDEAPVIRGAKRVSKPSKRVYLGVKDIKPVKFGAGTLFVSTPKGILTGSEARKALVGGEALFEIW